MRGLIEDIMYERRRGWGAMPFRFILRTLSILCGIIVYVRNLMYDKNILKSRQAPCRIICIGNLTAGGTGKTPVVIMTAKMLMDHGVKIAVVSRGYHRKSKGILEVSDGSRIVPPSEAGDEPHLIASMLPGVPVVVGNDRFLAAMFAFEKFKPNTIILDDGFQHRGLYRDVDILTMDAANPSGSDHLLPRGLLREPHRNMKRAKAIVFTRVDDPADRECSERTVRYYNKKIPLFFTRLDMAGLHEPGTGKQEPVSVLAGKKIAALSTIANPESFHKLLIKTGAQIVYTRIRPDHHRHTSGEMAEVIGKAGSSGAEYLVMTGKDERNLPAGMVPDTLKVRVLDIRAVLMEKEQDYLSMILPHGVGRIKG